jgi:predicted glycosyltransferase involved in capsule biosynthesis
MDYFIFNNSIFSLIPNKWKLLIGGTKGHQIVYGIKLNDDNTYDCAIINTGLGLNYHNKIIDNELLLYECVTIIRNKSLEIIENFVKIILLSKMTTNIDVLYVSLCNLFYSNSSFTNPNC